MRQQRLKLNNRDAVYHVFSRSVNGERLFHEKARAVFRKQLHALAEFCGMEVLTYAAMENHFHILVQVPKRMEPNREEVLRRAGVLYGEAREKRLRAELESDDPVRRRVAASTLKAYAARMGDLSLFLKELKSRFSKWYNQEHGRFGALWAERFKSVIVEMDPKVLLKVAAYIDLNPVRAGLCRVPDNDPKDYPWSGYGEAMRGEATGQAGLCRLCGVKKGKEALRIYRHYLYWRGAAETKPGAGVISGERSAEVLKRKGGLTLAEALRRRVDWFEEGAALGSRGFVEEIGRQFRDGLGRKREIGAKKAPEVYGEELTAMRKPRRKAIDLEKQDPL